MEDIFRCGFLIFHVPDESHAVGLMWSVFITAVWRRQQLRVLMGSTENRTGEGNVTETVLKAVLDTSSVITYLRWPVETGDHSVFGPALVRKLSVQREFGSSLRLSETNTIKQSQTTHHTEDTNHICWQINTLTPLYPEGPVRCSRKTRPPARRERAPRSESCGQRKSRTPPSEESAVSLPPSAHEGALHTETVPFSSWKAQLYFMFNYVCKHYLPLPLSETLSHLDSPEQAAALPNLPPPLPHLHTGV